MLRFFCVWAMVAVAATACGTGGRCSSASCPAGCCDAQDRCLPGNSSQACGQSGATCQSCSLVEVCQLGFCAPQLSGTGGSGSVQGGGTASAGGGSSGGGSGMGGGSSGGGSAVGGGGSAVGGGASGGGSAGSGGGMADAGVDAGVACTLGSCGATRTCNFTTGACQAASTCTTVNPQPDTCGYAGFCGSTTCAQVKPPTCSNFQQPGSMPSFNPRTNTGPIIYGFVDETIDDASFCGAPGSNIISYSLTLNVYRTDVDWPLATTALPGFFYVKTDGTKVSAVTMMRPSGYRPVGKTATFKVTLCSQATSNVSAGFYFDNGNEMCALAASGMSP